MEFGIVGALAYWGFHIGRNSFLKIILGISAPILIFGFWGLVDFRKAGTMAEYLRLVQELVLLGLAAVALFFSGQHVLAWVFSTYLCHSPYLCLHFR